MKKIGSFYLPDADHHFADYEQKGGIGNYQKAQRDYALTFVTDFKIAVDVGAHVGIFSTHFAQQFQTVHAFEPMPDVRECLQANVPDNVVVHSEALSHKNGRAVLFTPGLKNSGSSWIDIGEQPTDNIKDSRTTEVMAATLDSFDLPALGLIKIDAQGADDAVLIGARETIRKYRPVILVEEKPLGGPGGSMDHVRAIREILVSFGALGQNKVGADRVYIFR